MFDIGIQELVVVFLVALLVFGPKRLPELGRTLGKFMLEIRKGISEVKFQMESEFKKIEQQPAPQASQHNKEETLPGATVASGQDEGGKEGKA
jgi:Tat protein translocase TatB subunit